MNNEIKIYTLGNGEVVGINRCENGKYGKYEEVKYKTVKNAIRYLKLNKDEVEVFDIDKIASNKMGVALAPDMVGYIMASVTTLDERLRSVYTPILIGMTINSLINNLITSVESDKNLYKHSFKKYSKDLLKTSDNFIKEIKFNLRANPNIFNHLNEQVSIFMGDVNMPIMLLNFAFDAEVMKQAPKLERHKLLADIETIKFMSEYMMVYDEIFNELIRKRSGLPYNAKKDVFIKNIAYICECMMQEIVRQTDATIDFNGTTDKLGFNQVQIAWKSLDKHINESNWIDSIIKK